MPKLEQVTITAEQAADLRFFEHRRAEIVQERPVPGDFTAAMVKAGQAAYGSRWQSALARDAGISAQAVSFVVTGRRPPSREFVKAVYRALIAKNRHFAHAADCINDVAHVVAGMMV